MSPPAASADHHCLHKALRPVAGPSAFKNGPFQLSSSRDGVEGPGRMDARTSFFSPRVPHARVAIYPYFDLYCCTSRYLALDQTQDDYKKRPEDVLFLHSAVLRSQRCADVSSRRNGRIDYSCSCRPRSHGR